MILSVLAALLTALGPLLRGSWDLWAQSSLHLATIGCLTLWLLGCVCVGYLPLPSRRTLIWSGSLTVLGAISAWSSPLHALARPDWYNFLNALCLFPAMAGMTKDQRATVDEAIRVGAWILVGLAFYQHFSLGEQRPASALLNPNVYAGTILLLLPLAAEKRDWPLALGLLWSLAWTRSVGAWFGLSLALVLTQRRRSPARFWGGAAMACACAVALYGKLAGPEVLDRWWWWRAAAQMAWDRPWTGYGPGTYAYVLSAYQRWRAGGFFSLYAHNYPLQIMAEFGLPFALLWFAGLWHCVSRGDSHKRFGAVAILIQSLWDYALSLPANLWLFSYFAASSISHSSEGINIPARRKLPAALLAVGLAAVLSDGVIGFWEGERCAAKAQESLEAGRLEQARRWLGRAGEKVPDEPLIPQLAAVLEARRAAGAPDRGDWLQIAAYLEEAVRLNPHRPSAWTELALAYRNGGHPEAARAVAESGRPPAMR